MKTTFCERTGKVRHANRNKAVRQLGRVREGRSIRRRLGIPPRGLSNVTEIGVYQCPHCGDWHVGHRIGARATRRDRGDE